MTSKRWIGFLALCTMLVLPVGCGCGGDTTITTPVPETNQASFVVGAEIPPCEIPYVPSEIKVDVLFLQDDSFSFTDPAFGAIILGEIGPDRQKDDVAQAVFRHIANSLGARLAADYPGQDLDVAFGVGRYEDYSGFIRDGNRADAFPGTRDPVDLAARPFILNQPILRRAHPLFDLSFESALTRESTMGNGGRNPFDAQSALEALFQAVTGAGYDGNGNGTTTESGPAGVLATQTNPGVSGDVPAPVFVANGADSDGKPQYMLGSLTASGNLGGAGWRPDSIRFIITSSDVTTIALFGPNTTPAELANTDPGQPGVVTSSTDAGAPRTAATIPNQAFASILGTLADQEDERYGIYGTAAGPPYAAASGPSQRGRTVQEVIDALNEARVEVLSIGIRESFNSGPTKPNQPPPVLPGEEPAVQNPSVPPTNKAPFTWMSAVAILSGAVEPAGLNLPLVYNLTTVGPPDGLGGTLPTNDVIEDLSARVGAWLALIGTSPGPLPPAGSVLVDFTLGLAKTNPDLTIDGPDPTGAVPPGATAVGSTYLNVTIPCVYVDPTGAPVDENGEPTTRPDPVQIRWEGTVVRLSSSNLDPEVDEVSFSITAGNVRPPGGAVITPVTGAFDVDLPQVPASGPAPAGTVVLDRVTSGCALWAASLTPVCAPFP